MRFIALDCESHLIKPGLLAPRMVCLSFAYRPTPDKPVVTSLVLRERGLELIEEWLRDDDVTLLGHNIPYDFGLVAVANPGLLRLIFEKHQKGLVHDTQIRMQLHDIAEGQLKFRFDEDTGDMVKSSYHLADLSYRLNKRFVRKGSDTWRLRYALLDGIPIEGWPEDAKKYAIDDSEITLEVHEAQERLIQSVPWTFNADTNEHRLANQTEQHKAAWALHLMSMWGVRTDGSAVAQLKAALEEDYAEFMRLLRPSGLYNIAPERIGRRGANKDKVIPEKVSKFMKAIYARVDGCFKVRGETTPLTEGGRVATDRKTLLATGDPDLKRLAEVGAIAKLLQTYVPVLESGVFCPICARYNVLVDSGRTSCSKPNMQNPPKKGGVRDCFIPRPGKVFVFVDYTTLELCSLSQVCLDILGYSVMAEALRRGEDLHLAVAAEMLGISVEEAQQRFEAGDQEIREYRQQAKPANFGYPGGMGAEGFKEYAEGYGIILTQAQAEALRDAWFRKWPEMTDYFRFISRLTERSDQLTQVRSGRVRGGASYCATANSFFQGLAADGAKEALWRVAWECYIDETSALFGARPVIFLHDEIGIEVDYSDPVRAAAAAERLAVVMREAMEKWIPDVPIRCSPVMMKRWYKGAEAVYADGRVLVPCKPVKTEKKTTWVADIDAPTSPLLNNFAGRIDIASVSTMHVPSAASASG